MNSLSNKRKVLIVKTIAMLLILLLAFIGLSLLNSPGFELVVGSLVIAMIGIVVFVWVYVYDKEY